MFRICLSHLIYTVRPCLIHTYHAMPCLCHAPTMPFFSRPQHSTAVSRRPCCGLEKNGMVRAWHGHGMASVNQTRPHCVNQMGKTHSKPLAARHGRGTAWARHAMCESAFSTLIVNNAVETSKYAHLGIRCGPNLDLQLSLNCVSVAVGYRVA